MTSPARGGLVTLLDRVEISDVLATVTLLADEGSVDDYHLVYTPDVVWTSGETTLEGLAAKMADSRLRRRDGRRTGPASGTRHLAVPLRITVDGDRAAARSYYVLIADADRTPAVKRFGIYEDDLRRTPGGWRICRRVIRRDGEASGDRAVFPLEQASTDLTNKEADHGG